MARFDDLQETVDALEGKFDTLSASSQSADDQEIEELAMDLLPRLPSYPQEIPTYALQAMEGNAERGTRESIKYIIGASRNDEGIDEIDGTAQKLAREIRESTPPVREALCYLESETTENVKSAIVSGERHWMRGL